MKRYYFLLLAVLALLCSCNKHNPEPAPVPEPDQIVFDLSAIHPGEGLPSKARKTNWENGDVIFVFFTGVESPKYLKMSFNGSSWSSTEMDGKKTGSLGLANEDRGTMTAVYLPFGNGATVSEGADGSFVFSDTYYAYYLTGTLEYVVTANKVSGAFQMYIPEGFVQFFVEDANAADGAYRLETDAVVPVGLSSVAKDGTITELVEDVGVNLYGYAYCGGYLFSGKLNGSYAYAGNYYFAKLKASDLSREDYFVHVNGSLASHAAIALPANGNSKWIPVGNGKTVTLKKTVVPSNEIIDFGTWQTCNFGESQPEANWASDSDIMKKFQELADTNKLPSKIQFDTIRKSLPWYPVSVHTKPCQVVKSDTGFMLLPMNKISKQGYYWTRSLDKENPNLIWSFYIDIDGNMKLDESVWADNRKYYARYMQ